MFGGNLGEYVFAHCCRTSFNRLSTELARANVMWFDRFHWLWCGNFLRETSGEHVWRGYVRWMTIRCAGDAAAQQRRREMLNTWCRPNDQAVDRRETQRHQIQAPTEGDLLFWTVTENPLARSGLFVTRPHLMKQ
jgi:hypothetical protein